MSDDELKALWQAAEGLEQPYEAFIKLLILTGQRRNEVAEMTWRELDLAAKLGLYQKSVRRMIAKPSRYRIRPSRF